MGMTVSYTDTATVPVTGARALAPKPINYASDFRVVSEGPNEVVLSNIIAPLLQPETVRIAFSEVADVFKGSKVDAPISSSLTKKGSSVLVQVNGVALESVTSAPIPYSAHLVLKMPNAGDPSAANIQLILERLLGHLYGTKETTIATRVAGFLRGAITPVEL